MTLLSVCEAVAPQIGINVPTTVVGSTDDDMIDLRAVVRRAAKRIAKGHTWRALTAQASIAGDGTTKAFAITAVAADYDRMPADGQMWTTRLDVPLRHISSLDDWLEIDIREFDYLTGAWTLYGGNFQFTPAPESTETIRFWYQSKNIWTGADTVNKEEFSADADIYRLDEHLLELGTIFEWKHSKGLSYAEDLASFEERFSELATSDRGARIIRTGRGRLPRGVAVAYPRTIPIP